MSSFTKTKKVRETALLSLSFTSRIQLLRKAFLCLLLFNSFLSFAEDFRGEISISGDVTLQKLGEEKSISTSDAQLTLWLGDSLFKELATTKSGLFSFNLKVGHDYTLKCQKSGYATKYVNFLLKDVDSNLIEKDNKDFDLSVNLISSDFLTEDVITRTGQSDVYWDFRYNGLSYSNRQLQKRWSIIDSISREYQMALKNLPSKDLSNQIASLPDSINWPKGIGANFDVGVYGEYPLYVSLVIEKNANAAFSNINLSYLNDIRMLSEAELDLLVLNDQSFTLSKDSMQAIGDDVLIASASDSELAMVQFSIEGESRINVINDLEFSENGFSLVHSSGILADNKWDEELQQESGTSVKDSKAQMDLTAALKRQEEALFLKNEALRLVQKSFDSISAVKSNVFAELAKEIADAEKILANLDLDNNERKNTAQTNILEAGSMTLSKSNRETGSKEVQQLPIMQKEEFAGLNDDFADINADVIELNPKFEDSEKFDLLIGLVLSSIIIMLFLIYRSYKGGMSNKKLKGEIGFKAKKLFLQRAQLEQKNKEMSDSINYAKRIQLAMLPQAGAIQECFKESFVIYQPKDVVAGDFFWMKELNDLIYFAVADCTGHGVPGAMMSVLCHGALNRALRESESPNPGDLLALTRKFVIAQIAIGEGHVMDGMDIALCAYNKKTRELQFSGAQNPLWIASERLIEHPNIRSNKFEFGPGYLNEIKGDKQPVGEFYASSSFTNHSIFLAEGDTIYIFSDGFPDQFGGRNGKKLKNSLFKELIGLVQDQQDLEKQKEFLSEYFINWKGDLEQVDDVCVMGIRF